jgi:hypothetical protein
MNRLASKALFDDQVKALEGEILVIRRWTVFSRTFPILDVGFEHEDRSPFRVQTNCEDWNELPPWITLLAFEGTILTSLPTGPTGVFNQALHDITKRPFICMAGSREYHTHPSHIADVWENYKSRSGYELGGLLTQIWSAWLKSTP